MGAIVREVFTCCDYLLLFLEDLCVEEEEMDRVATLGETGGEGGVEGSDASDDDAARGTFILREFFVVLSNNRQDWRREVKGLREGEGDVGEQRA